MQKNRSNTIQIKLENGHAIKALQSDDLENGIGYGWVFPSQSVNANSDHLEESTILDTNQTIQNRVSHLFNDSNIEMNEELLVDDMKPIEKRFVSKTAILMKYFLPVVIALAIGSSLGFGALHILENQNQKQVEKVAASPNKTINPGENPSQVAAAQNKSTLYEKNLTVSMIQAGVFSTKEAAETQKSTLSVNVPSVIIATNDKFALFIGITDSLEHAKTHALNFQKINLEAFWKDVTFSGPTKKAYSKDEKEKIARVVENFIELRAGLASEKLGSSVMENHASEVKLAKEKEILAELIKANNNAMKSFESYKKTPSSMGLITFEQKMLELLKVFSEM
jgi:stage II sporulation protein B